MKYAFYKIIYLKILKKNNNKYLFACTNVKIYCKFTVLIYLFTVNLSRIFSS